MPVIRKTILAKSGLASLLGAAMMWQVVSAADSEIRSSAMSGVGTGEEQPAVANLRQLRFESVEKLACLSAPLELDAPEFEGVPDDTIHENPNAFGRFRHGEEAQLNPGSIAALFGCSDAGFVKG